MCATVHKVKTASPIIDDYKSVRLKYLLGVSKLRIPRGQYLLVGNAYHLLLIVIVWQPEKRESLSHSYTEAW